MKWERNWSERGIKREKTRAGANSNYRYARALSSKTNSQIKKLVWKCLKNINKISMNPFPRKNILKVARKFFEIFLKFSNIYSGTIL